MNMTNITASMLPAIVPQRKIFGISAILLPFAKDHSVDWVGFSAHIERTIEAGLTPAVNMDTGYANLIDASTRKEVLARTREITGSKTFVAGAYVQDNPEDKWNPDAYCRQLEEVQSYNALPLIFQSYGLTNQENGQIVASYETLAESATQFIAFELGKMFAPFGKIYDMEVYARIMAIPQCIGAKHSSLERTLEWDRLALRNKQRPDFKVFTGNDLAIDMVMYGSDYLLGLSSFAPDLFGYRDRLWEKGDSAFYQLNDLLQYLGSFAFRTPIPAYKHSAAQFLKLRQWIACDNTHPNSPTRPDSDVDILRDIADRCKAWSSQI
jgi:dihydrodipicolinate synthase/N-acetylneuraminate lyase